MKKLILLTIAFIELLSFTNCKVNAQGVGINPSGSNPDPSAILDVNSPTQGVLLSRLTTAEINSISLPANGLLVYNKDCNYFLYNVGTPTAPNWVAINSPILPAPAGTITGSASVCQGQNNVSYSVPNIANATSYTWAYSGTGATISGTTNSITINFSGAATSGNLTVLGSNPCGNGTLSANYVITVNAVPVLPTASAHTPSQTQIVWNWNTVSGATGYKWGTTNVYSSATDMITATSTTETGLTCNTAYTRYIWAYNSCGNSSSTVLNQTTSACCVGPFTTCGNSFCVNHTAGAVAPETKTVNYGTILTTIGGTGAKCWITQNLGSGNQATSATDATEASAGWYWQFNRKQGYKHDGTTRTPNTAWITTIDEVNDWLAANDPCTIELGAGWRIPTKTEWTNADANGQVGGWDNYNETYADVLKLHAAGYLDVTSGTMYDRGIYGNYWSRTQVNNTLSWDLRFGSGFSEGDGIHPKAIGFNLRCIKD